MRLSKRQSKTLSILILLIFMGGSILFVRNPTQDNLALNANVTASQVVDSDLPESETNPVEEEMVSALSLDDFQRSETRDGKTIWDVKGKNAKFFPKENAVLITDGRLNFNTQDDKPVFVQGGEAFLTLDGVSLQKAELSKAVTLRFDERIVMQSEVAIYDPIAETIAVPGEVKIESELLEVTGTGMETNLKLQEAHILSNVRSIIKPKRKITR